MCVWLPKEADAFAASFASVLAPLSPLPWANGWGRMVTRCGNQARQQMMIMVPDYVPTFHYDDPLKTDGNRYPRI